MAKMKKEKVKESRLQRARVKAKRFKGEFKKQSLVAISAAFGFLIALSWREPISDIVNKMIVNLGLNEGAIYFKFFSAIVVTIVAVLLLMLMAKWSVEKEG